MWKEGNFEIENNSFQYKVKIMPANYNGGLHGGRVVKLTILHNTENERKLIFDPIAHYDDGWNVKPRNSIGKKALEYVLGLFE